MLSAPPQSKYTLRRNLYVGDFAIDRLRFLGWGGGGGGVMKRPWKFH